MAKNTLRRYLHDRKEMFEKYLQSLKPADKKKKSPKSKAGRTG